MLVMKTFVAADVSSYSDQEISAHHAHERSPSCTLLNMESRAKSFNPECRNRIST